VVLALRQALQLRRRQAEVGSGVRGALRGGHPPNHTPPAPEVPCARVSAAGSAGTHHPIHSLDGRPVVPRARPKRH
jgi:hypothetical protein